VVGRSTVLREDRWPRPWWEQDLRSSSALDDEDDAGLARRVIAEIVRRRASNKGAPETILRGESSGGWNPDANHGERRAVESLENERKCWAPRCLKVACQAFGTDSICDLVADSLAEAGGTKAQVMRDPAKKR